MVGVSRCVWTQGDPSLAPVLRVTHLTRMRGDAQVGIFVLVS